MARPERCQHALALVLRLVAVDRLGSEAGLGQRANDLIGPAFGAGEDQHALDRLFPQHFREQARFAGAIDMDHPLLDTLHGGRRGSYRNPNWIAQHMACEIGDLARHGGREEQRLALARQLRHDPADVVDEAHVEHAIGFIQHEDFDAIELNGAALHEVEKSSRCCDQDVDPVGERADLAVDGDAADGERYPQTQIAAVGLEAFDDLGGEFARGTQHQYPAAAWLRPSAGTREVIEDGQCESRGLAGSGLRDADHVPRGEHLRNGLGLDWGGGGILLVDERTGDGLAEAEVEKGGQSGIFLMARRTGAPNVRIDPTLVLLDAQIGSSRLRWRAAACRGEIRHPAWSGLSMN